MDEAKGTAFIILGIVAIIAVVGLVLLLTQRSATGKVPSSVTGCDFGAAVTGPPDQNAQFLTQYTNAGYTCMKSPETDVYGQESWCCTAPQGVPVNQRSETVPVSYNS